jgi:glycosyltransferase involved in cell wall biosynthesis
VIKRPKELAKAIIEVIKDLQKAGKMGNAARSTVKRLHGAEVVASQLKLAFEKAFKESKKKR